MEKTILDIPLQVLDSYYAIRTLPDGRVCGVHKLLYHWTFHIDIDYCGYADRYCFYELKDALKALYDYDGKTEPIGWHRHPDSGRRRNLETGEEWVAD